MNVLSGLSRAAVAVTAATVLGSTLAVTGAILSGPARAAAVIDTSSQSAFLRSIAPLAQEGQRAYRVPASVAMAQAILESGWGKSTLTTRGNAFFGIKCSTVMGPYATGCLNMRTREVFNGTPTFIIDGFRTYDDPVDSFRDHGRFLTVNSRYRAAFNYPDDPKRFIAEVHRAGYATDPTYTAMVVGLMDQFNLYRYDTLPATTAAASAAPSRTPSAQVTETASVVPSVTASVVPSETASVVPSETTAIVPSVSPSSPAIPSASPSSVATPTLSKMPQAVPSTLYPRRTPDVVASDLDVIPSASTDQVPYAVQTPSATVSPSATTSPSATVSPSATTSPSAIVSSSTTTSPSATTTPSVATALDATPTVTPSVDPSVTPPSVGVGVLPDPSMDPEATVSEDLRMSAESASANSLATAAIDVQHVEATKPQDQAKAGALFPDGTQVAVTGVRQKQRHGGLAKTGW